MAQGLRAAYNPQLKQITIREKIGKDNIKFIFTGVNRKERKKGDGRVTVCDEVGVRVKS